MCSSSEKKKKKKKINEQNNSEEVGTSHPLPRGQDGTSAFFKKLCNSPMVWDYILLCPQRGDREIKTLACWEKKKKVWVVDWALFWLLLLLLLVMQWNHIRICFGDLTCGLQEGGRGTELLLLCAQHYEKIKKNFFFKKRLLSPLDKSAQVFPRHPNARRK